MRCFSSSGSRARRPSPPRRSTRATFTAIAPYLKVLERLDRYHKAGATKPVYDAAARERLFAKMSRIVDRLEAKARKEAQQAAADPIGGAAERSQEADAG